MCLAIFNQFLKCFKDEEDIIKLKLSKCIQSVDCRLQIVLDKKNANSMTFCVTVIEVEICFVSTCTCATNRTRREIHSPMITENPISGPKIKKPTCSSKLIPRKLYMTKIEKIVLIQKMTCL